MENANIARRHDMLFAKPRRWRGQARETEIDCPFRHHSFYRKIIPRGNFDSDRTGFRQKSLD